MVSGNCILPLFVQFLPCIIWAPIPSLGTLVALSHSPEWKTVCSCTIPSEPTGDCIHYYALHTHTFIVTQICWPEQRGRGKLSSHPTHLDAMVPVFRRVQDRNCILKQAPATNEALLLSILAVLVHGDICLLGSHFCSCLHTKSYCLFRTQFKPHPPSREKCKSHLPAKAYQGLISAALP